MEREKRLQKQAADRNRRSDMKRLFILMKSYLLRATGRDEKDFLTKQQILEETIKYIKYVQRSPRMSLGLNEPHCSYRDYSLYKRAYEELWLKNEKDTASEKTLSSQQPFMNKTLNNTPVINFQQYATNAVSYQYQPYQVPQRSQQMNILPRNDDPQIWRPW